MAIQDTGNSSAVTTIAEEHQDVIGACLVGNFMHEPPPDRQIEVTQNLSAAIQQVVGRPLWLSGHRKLGQTDCPGDTWLDWKPHLLAPEPTLPEPEPPPPIDWEAQIADYQGRLVQIDELARDIMSIAQDES